MELLQTENYYILNNNEDALWFDRRTGCIEFKTCWDMVNAKNPSCLGIVHGIIGKIQILSDIASRLALITDIKEVGSLGDHKIYCITKVAFLPLSTSSFDCELNLPPCHKHHTHHPNSTGAPLDRKNILPFGDFQQKVGLTKTLGTLKNVTSSIKSATVNAAVTATFQNKTKKEFRDKEKFEKRILDELYKMFNEYHSFYFSYEADITNSLERQNDSSSYNELLPLWKRADERFFWNKQMLTEFETLKDDLPSCWMIPIIQGFVQFENIPLDTGLNGRTVKDAEQPDAGETSYQIALVSRRSRHRAGTRYKRRGVDETGFVANYVETEQIITFSHHQIAFVQIRGSVPVFWSQPGYKYRPPPRLDRDYDEISLAFKAHFERELSIYKNVSCISLVEQGGKEKVIADAYLDHVMTLDSANLTFVSFDFHEYCRGMRYENVSVLIESIEELISEMAYCWVDKEGVICKQKGIFRTSCIDCLDRTNVVQTAFAKAVVENQFAKLGILPPDRSLPLPQNCRSVLQLMWANNGDNISKQYAGTSALKGDFTRTGERNFAGLMKDGMNSANRYYLNRFKDAYRQATIDTMLGNAVSEDLLNLNDAAAAASGSDEEEASLALHVKHVIDDCKKFLVPDPETILGAWGLIDADPTSGDPDQTDMDIILVLTRDSYYVAQYEEETDRILHFERVSLIDLDKIEIGPFTFQGMFKQSKTYFCIRCNYQEDGQSGYFHTFRSMNIRFFNNLAVGIKTEEEIIESVKAIANTFEMAAQMIGCEMEICIGKMEKLKRVRGSRLINPLHLLSSPFTKSSPDSLKSVGSRAFSNVTSGLAKLNPIANLRSKLADTSQTITNNQSPSVPIINLVMEKTPKSDLYLTSCGIVSSCTKPQEPLPPSGKIISPQQKSLSDSQLPHYKRSVPLFTNRTPTPEILVSREVDLDNNRSSSRHAPTKMWENFIYYKTSASVGRVRKHSHSSEDVRGDGAADDQAGDEALQRASSATELDLTITDNKRSSKLMSSSPLTSPLANINKETVLAPFTVLARGVQSLAPGAGKFARGVQNIGANLDPRNLRAQRQKQLEENLEMKSRTLKCRSRIIQL